MPEHTSKAKTIAIMLMGLLAFLVFSLIPWLIVANLLSWFRMCEDKGWIGMSRFCEISGIVLAVATAAWTAFGLIYWLVKLVRVIFDSDSRDEKRVA
jgi:hypothetical protein